MLTFNQPFRMKIILYCFLFFNSLLFGKFIELDKQLNYDNNQINENIWIPETIRKQLKSFPSEQRQLECEFNTNVEVSAVCEYPSFHGNDVFINFVNNALETEAKEVFANFIKQEQIIQEDIDQGFGDCFLCFDLFPAYFSSNLISIYGYELQQRACPHGWTHYYGKNFWKKGTTIREIALSHIFIQESDWCNFLLSYCDTYFKNTEYGYYKTDYGITPELEPKDLDTFILTEKGLMIIFQPYRVWGWADGPSSITIPYENIKGFIDPNGPLNNIPKMQCILNN